MNLNLRVSDCFYGLIILLNTHYLEFLYCGFALIILLKIRFKN